MADIDMGGSEDFPNSGLTAGNQGQEDLKKGLYKPLFYPEPDVPTFDSPGLANKKSLGGGAEGVPVDL